MKILVLTKTLSPDSGGGRYSRSVLEEYLKKGISFKVLTQAGGSPEPYEERCILSAGSAFSFFKNILIVRNRAKDYDIVHAFDGWPYAVCARLAILFSKKSLFINAVGTYAVAALKSPLKGPLLANAYRTAVKIFPISKFVEGNVLKYIKLDNLKVAYLGTTPLTEPASAEVEDFKKRRGIAGQNPVLLTVGALKDRKGHFETVQAVARLRARHPGILYCIVGSREGADAYMKKINDYIREERLEAHVKIFSDIRTDAELACMYAASTIFLLNSKYDKDSEHSEGFGLVLLEAAHFGKPVIGSKGSGIPEAMEDGRNGYLVEEVRAEDIAEAVEKVLANYEELSRNSPAVARKFTWERTASAYIDGYEKLKA